jgi:hypothetical protein
MMTMTTMIFNHLGFMKGRSRNAPAFSISNPPALLNTYIMSGRKLEIWKNIKNGTYYWVHSMKTINCTNSANDEVMISYHPVDDLAKDYVREKKEFREKFVRATDGEINNLPVNDLLKILQLISAMKNIIGDQLY